MVRSQPLDFFQAQADESSPRQALHMPPYTIILPHQKLSTFILSSPRVDMSFHDSLMIRHHEPLLPHHSSWLAQRAITKDEFACSEPLIQLYAPSMR